MNKLTSILFLMSLIIMGCMDASEEPIEVIDKGKGGTLTVEVLEIDSTDNTLKVKDVSTGEVFDVEILSSDFDKGTATVVNLTKVDTIDIKIESFTLGTDSLATTSSSMTVSSSITVSSSSQSSISSSTLVYSSLEEPLVSDSCALSEDSLVIIQENLKSCFEKLGQEPVAVNVYPEDSPLYFDAPVKPYAGENDYYQMEIYKRSKSTAYVFDNRLLIHIPDSNIVPEVVKDVDAERLEVNWAAAIKDIKAYLRVNPSRYPPGVTSIEEYDLYYILYGEVRSDDVDITDPLYVAKATGHDYSSNMDGDGDHLHGKYDLGRYIGFIFGNDEKMGTLRVNWLEFMIANPNLAELAVYYIQALEIDASKPLGIHLTNNPFKWYAAYIYFRYGRNELSDL